MFAEVLDVMRHGPALADYRGIFALFREGRAMVSLPPERFEELSGRLPPGPVDPDVWAAAFREHGWRVIGPAFMGYAEWMPESSGSAARELREDDMPAVARLAAACDPEEWEHGGSDPAEVPCSGVFTAAGEVAALAGYEVWSGTIAHISIVTHPEHRGRGYGREAVAHLAKRALAAGLLPQYRTLEANAASMRIGAGV
jgi:GNAT superfamily N-acetyltransferase